MVFSLITTTLYIYRYYFFIINVIIIVNIIFCNACFVKLLNTRRPRDLLDWIAIDMPQFEFMNKIYQMFCSSLSCKPRLGLDKWWVYVWQFSLHWLKYRKGRQRTYCFDLFTTKDWHNIKAAFYSQLRSPAQMFGNEMKQDFGNENSSSHELNKITRESKVTSFKFRFIPKARRIPQQRRNHVLVATSPTAK